MNDPLTINQKSIISQDTFLFLYHKLWEGMTVSRSNSFGGSISSTLEQSWTASAEATVGVYKAVSESSSSINAKGLDYYYHSSCGKG